MSFGVISGVAVGFGYLPSLYIAWTYFPDNKSTVTGLILFFAGLSALTLAPMTTCIVNPNNMDPSDPEVYQNVPKMFYIITIYYTSIFVVSTALQPMPWFIEDQKDKIKEEKERKIKAAIKSPRKLLDKNISDDEKSDCNARKLSKKMDSQDDVQVGPVNSNRNLLGNRDNDRFIKEKKGPDTFFKKRNS